MCTSRGSRRKDGGRSRAARRRRPAGAAQAPRRRALRERRRPRGRQPRGAREIRWSLDELAQAYVRERCDEPVAPDPKRQRLPSVVCSGGWEAQRKSIAELEATHGDGAYQEYELNLDGNDDGPYSRKLRVREFSDYFFSSGCRVWDASAALALDLGGERVPSATCSSSAPASASPASSPRSTSRAASCSRTTSRCCCPTCGINCARFRVTHGALRWPLEVSQLDWSDPPADLARRARHLRRDSGLRRRLLERRRHRARRRGSRAAEAGRHAVHVVRRRPPRAGRSSRRSSRRRALAARR